MDSRAQVHHWQEAYTLSEFELIILTEMRVEEREMVDPRDYYSEWWRARGVDPYR